MAHSQGSHNDRGDRDQGSDSFYSLLLDSFVQPSRLIVGGLHRIVRSVLPDDPTPPHQDELLALEQKCFEQNSMFMKLIMRMRERCEKMQEEHVRMKEKYELRMKEQCVTIEEQRVMIEEQRVTIEEQRVMI